MQDGHEVTQVHVSEENHGTQKAFFRAAGCNQYGMTLWLLTVNTAEEVDAYLELRGENDRVACSACATSLVNYPPNGICESCQRDLE